MPIDYSDYPKNWKTEIVPAVLVRAGHCCEFCGLENGQSVWSVKYLLGVMERLEILYLPGAIVKFGLEMNVMH